MIAVTGFRQIPADCDKPDRAEAIASFPQPDGTVCTARISLFILADGRIGIGVYPSGDRGAVFRWDGGPEADPSVIFWQAPHCEADQCDSPCGHQATGEALSPGEGGDEDGQA